MRGSTIVRRSSSSRIAPVVNRTRPGSRRADVNRGKPTRRPPRAPVPAGVPVAQRARQISQTARVCLLGVLRPPRRHLVLDPVPRPPQRTKVPAHRHMPRIEFPGVHVGLHLSQAPIERFAPRPEMRTDYPTSIRIRGPFDLELRRSHKPARRHLLTQDPRRGIPAALTVVQVEQHRHRLHHLPVGFEIRSDIDIPRQCWCAITFRLTSKMGTTRQGGYPLGLPTRTHPDNHAAPPGSPLAAVSARIALFRAPRRP